MPRIALAGFQHETNSQGIGHAGLAEFEMADSWPAMMHGAPVIDSTRGMNLPVAGFVTAAEQAGATLAPILWGSAEPSGPVTDAAFDTIATRILDGLGAAAPLDGVYLDLHGAMITDSHPDGEGALLARIRDQLGAALPIAVSLDLHANISAQMVALADVLCIYKTYPHLDMAETGARAWTRLSAILEGARPAKAFRPGPYLIPLQAQQTGADPARALYQGLVDASDRHVELAMGFTAADTPYVGPALVAYAPDQATADAEADAALQKLLDAEPEFEMRLAQPAAAVANAMAEPPGRPVILADVQDNPGAGGSSDTTGILRALVAAGAQDALVGLMHDPALAAQAHAAGLGAELNSVMGGNSGAKGDAPYKGRFVVEALSAGQVRYTGAMYGGGIGTLGPSCALRVMDGAAGVVVVVTSIRNQCLDLAQFRLFGLEPQKARIIVVKSTAHFRADFEPIASRILTVAAPGLFPCALADMHYARDAIKKRAGPR